MGLMYLPFIPTVPYEHSKAPSTPHLSFQFQDGETEGSIDPIANDCIARVFRDVCLSDAEITAFTMIC